MSKLDEQIQATIDAFVHELTELVREAAVASVAEALGGAAGGRGVVARTSGRSPRGAKSRGGRAAAPASPARSRSGAGARRKGEKRSPAELQQLTTKLYQEIAARPGQRMEQIGKTLGLTTKELQLPVRKLWDDGKIKTRGEKRAMKYYPA